MAPVVKFKALLSIEPAMTRGVCGRLTSLIGDLGPQWPGTHQVGGGGGGGAAQCQPVLVLVLEAGVLTPLEHEPPPRGHRARQVVEAFAGDVGRGC